MNYIVTARNGRISIRTLQKSTRISDKVTPETAEFITGEVEKIAPKIAQYRELKAQWATDDSVAEKMMEVWSEIQSKTADIEQAATRIQNG